MDFSLTDEQQMLKESVDRFVRDAYSLEQRRKLAASDIGYSEDHWRRMAELGWLAVAIPEEYGGIGGGPVEVMVLMEAFGRGLVLEPFLPSVVLGGGLVLAAGSEKQKQAILPALAEGTHKLAFAFVEPQSGYDLFDVELRAERQGDGWRLSGRKGVVLGAPTADTIVVSARTGGESRSTQGLSLFLVAAGAEGLSRRDYGTQDALRASELGFDGVSLAPEALLGPEGGAWPYIEQAAQRGIAALCAEATGAMDVLVETTNQYLKDRRQFGRPLGDFQVLQHRMVDMFMAAEEARSMTYVATCRLDVDPKARTKALAGAKVTIGRAGRTVGQGAVQLHGGMGMTDELHVSHYFKRLAMIDLMFGDQTYHLKRYASQL